MSNANLIPLGVVAIVVLAVGAGLLSQRHPAPASPTATPTTSVSPVAASAASTNTVSLQNFAFVPAAITVKAGTKVTWTNMDAANHSVVSDMAGMGPESALFARDTSYSYVFSTPGTYTYHCMPHPYMHGSVTVTN